jgi:nitroreductase
VLRALLQRRSVRPRRLQPPGPNGEDVCAIVAAGLRGSDHGGLRPWRIIQIEDRAALTEAFVAAERELRPDAEPEALARARSRAQNGPCLLVLVARLHQDAPETPAHEQWISIGSALNQMLLAANALGFDGGILSGRKTRTKALRAALLIAPEEQIAGFLTLGAAAADTAPAAPEDPGAFITRWPPFKA